MGFFDFVGEIFGQSSDSDDTRLQGARDQAAIEEKNRGVQRKTFEGQIERQQPFVDTGVRALSPFIESISNRGETGLPAEQIQARQISEFLGDQAPSFVKNDALANLEAVELEKNKGRLSNLIDIGLGGIGATGQSGQQLGANVGQSLAQSGNINAGILTQGAVDRQNRFNRILEGVSSIPGAVTTATGGDISFRNGNFDPLNLITF